MIGRIKKLFGFNSDVIDPENPNQAAQELAEEFDLSSDAYADYDDLFVPRQARRARPIGYIDTAWYGLKRIKAKLQDGILSALEKIYNGVFYGVAFNLTLFLFARTIGFLAAGSFGWALLTIIPAYIAFLSTGPIYDAVSRFVKFTVPPVFSAIKTVAKAIGTRILSHILRVTGIADYARTANPGEFFGKVKLPTIAVANDDDVEPNPDATSNLAIYGPDINLGPLSVGTSLRFNWSFVKYIKHAPQYIKYWLNWIMKKSGLEDFARSVTTPLLEQSLKEDQSEHSMYRSQLHDFIKHIPENPKVEAGDREQARNFVAAMNPGMSKTQLDAAVEAHLAITHPQIDPETRLARAIDKYQEETNDKIGALHKSAQESINRFLQEFKYPKIITESQIKDTVESSQIAPKKLIEAKTPKFQKAYQENIEPVAIASLLLDTIGVTSSPQIITLLETGVRAKGHIDAAFNQLSSDIQSYRDTFMSEFNKKIAALVRKHKPKESIAQSKASAAPMLSQYERKRWTPEEVQAMWDKKLAAKKRLDESIALHNQSVTKESQAAAEQEKETRARMHQEDEAHLEQQQTMADGRTYGRKSNNST
jgi:uncharacterized protein YdaU (DUF1376 family)